MTCCIYCSTIYTAFGKENKEIKARNLAQTCRLGAFLMVIAWKESHTSSAYFLATPCFVACHLDFELRDRALIASRVTKCASYVCTKFTFLCLFTFLPVNRTPEFEQNGGSERASLWLPIKFDGSPDKTPVKTNDQRKWVPVQTWVCCTNLTQYIYRKDIRKL